MWRISTLIAVTESSLNSTSAVQYERQKHRENLKPKSTPPPTYEKPAAPKLLPLINILSLPSSIYDLIVNVPFFSSHFFTGFYGGLGYALGRSFHGRFLTNR